MYSTKVSEGTQVLIAPRYWEVSTIFQVGVGHRQLPCMCQTSSQQRFLATLIRYNPSKKRTWCLIKYLRYNFHTGGDVRLSKSSQCRPLAHAFVKAALQLRGMLSEAWCLGLAQQCGQLAASGQHIDAQEELEPGMKPHPRMILQTDQCEPSTKMGRGPIPGMAQHGAWSEIPLEVMVWSVGPLTSSGMPAYPPMGRGLWDTPASPSQGGGGLSVVEPIIL
jgi:hypothetical protein